MLVNSISYFEEAGRFHKTAALRHAVDSTSQVMEKMFTNEAQDRLFFKKKKEAGVLKNVWEAANTPIPGTPKLLAGRGLAALKGESTQVVKSNVVKPKTREQVLAARRASYKTAGLNKEAAQLVAAYREFREKLSFTQSQYGATGGFVDFHQVSSQPGFRKPSLGRVVQKEADFAAKTAGPITPTGLTPSSRLASSMRIGKPRVTNPSGPSIGDIAKPQGFGKKIPGATLGP